LGKAAAMAPAAWRGGLAGRRAWPGDSPPGGDRSVDHDMHQGC
jgi:hypothetical protein